MNVAPRYMAQFDYMAAEVLPELEMVLCGCFTSVIGIELEQDKQLITK